VFYGNGFEVWAFSHIIDKSLSSSSDERKLFGDLLEALVDTTSYYYVPYEDVRGLSSSHNVTGMRKLDGRVGAFTNVLSFLNNKASERGQRFEVATNIMLPPADRTGITQQYYAIMDALSRQHDNLLLRYNTFFLIPSNCAKHIDALRQQYTLYSDAYPELKLVSVPQVLPEGGSTEVLEEMLLESMLAAQQSRSYRRLHGGTYSRR
jgi:hypothetical protein